jgi:hypothetical protein
MASVSLETVHRGPHASPPSKRERLAGDQSCLPASRDRYRPYACGTTEPEVKAT